MRDSALAGYFKDALAAGLPPFAVPESLSTPLNSSPYATSLGHLRASFAPWPRWTELLALFDDAIGFAQRAGARVEVALIGGSFTDFSKPIPHDIDVVLFYRQSAEAGVRGECLAALQRDMKLRGMDCRFIPMDGEAMITFKALSFFSLLFSKRATGDPTMTRGLLLVDCRDAPRR